MVSLNTHTGLWSVDVQHMNQSNNTNVKSNRCAAENMYSNMNEYSNVTTGENKYSTLDGRKNRFSNSYTSLHKYSTMSNDGRNYAKRHEDLSGSEIKETLACNMTNEDDHLYTEIPVCGYSLLKGDFKSKDDCSVNFKKCEENKHYTTDDSDDSGTVCGDEGWSSEDEGLVRFNERFHHLFSTSLPPPPLTRQITCFTYTSDINKKRRAPNPPPLFFVESALDRRKSFSCLETSSKETASTKSLLPHHMMVCRRLSLAGRFPRLRFSSSKLPPPFSRTAPSTLQSSTRPTQPGDPSTGPSLDSLPVSCYASSVSSFGQSLQSNSTFSSLSSSSSLSRSYSSFCSKRMALPRRFENNCKKYEAIYDLVDSCSDQFSSEITSTCGTSSFSSLLTVGTNEISKSTDFSERCLTPPIIKYNNTFKLPKKSIETNCNENSEYKSLATILPSGLRGSVSSTVSLSLFNEGNGLHDNSQLNTEDGSTGVTGGSSGCPFPSNEKDKKIKDKKPRFRSSFKNQSFRLKDRKQDSKTHDTSQKKSIRKWLSAVSLMKRDSDFDSELSGGWIDQNNCENNNTICTEFVECRPNLKKYDISASRERISPNSIKQNRIPFKMPASLLKLNKKSSISHSLTELNSFNKVQALRKDTRYNSCLTVKHVELEQANIILPRECKSKEPPIYENVISVPQIKRVKKYKQPLPLKVRPKLCMEHFSPNNNNEQHVDSFETKQYKTVEGKYKQFIRTEKTDEYENLPPRSIPTLEISQHEHFVNYNNTLLSDINENDIDNTKMIYSPNNENMRSTPTPKTLDDQKLQEEIHLNIETFPSKIHSPTLINLANRTNRHVHHNYNNKNTGNTKNDSSTMARSQPSSPIAFRRNVTPGVKESVKELIKRFSSLETLIDAPSFGKKCDENCAQSRKTQVNRTINDEPGYKNTETARLSRRNYKYNTMGKDTIDKFKNINMANSETYIQSGTKSVGFNKARHFSNNLSQETSHPVMSNSSVAKTPPTFEQSEIPYFRKLDDSTKGSSDDNDDSPFTVMIKNSPILKSWTRQHTQDSFVDLSIIEISKDCNEKNPQLNIHNDTPTKLKTEIVSYGESSENNHTKISHKNIPVILDRNMNIATTKREHNYAGIRKTYECNKQRCNTEHIIKHTSNLKRSPFQRFKDSFFSSFHQHQRQHCSARRKVLQESHSVPSNEEQSKTIHESGNTASKASYIQLRSLRAWKDFKNATKVTDLNSSSSNNSLKPLNECSKSLSSEWLLSSTLSQSTTNVASKHCHSVSRFSMLSELNEHSFSSLSTDTVEKRPSYDELHKYNSMLNESEVPSLLNKELNSIDDRDRSITYTEQRSHGILHEPIQSNNFVATNDHRAYSNMYDSTPSVQQYCTNDTNLTSLNYQSNPFFEFTTEIMKNGINVATSQPEFQQKRLPPPPLPLLSLPLLGLARSLSPLSPSLPSTRPPSWSLLETPGTSALSLPPPTPPPFFCTKKKYSSTKERSSFTK